MSLEARFGAAHGPAGDEGSSDADLQKRFPFKVMCTAGVPGGTLEADSVTLVQVLAGREKLTPLRPTGQERIADSRADRAVPVRRMAWLKLIATAVDIARSSAFSRRIPQARNLPDFGESRLARTRLQTAGAVCTGKTAVPPAGLSRSWYGTLR